MRTASHPGSAVYHRTQPLNSWFASDPTGATFGDAWLNPVEYLQPVFPFGYDPGKRFLLEWAAAMINRLIDLPQDWDGDGAAAIDITAARAAIDFLESIADTDTVSPQIFPLASGGVQMEWLVNGVTLEVEVAPNGHLYAMGMDRHGKVDLDGDVADRAGAALQSDVREYLRSMSLPLRAER